MKSYPIRSRRFQRGVTTLAITLILLAIVTVAALFAVSVGMLEQRSSASEYRHKLVFQVAEAGLNQAAEYAKVNAGLMNSSGTGGWFNPANVLWQPCSEAKPAAMRIDPCLTEPDPDRQNQMYRYVGGGDGVLPLSPVMPILTRVGGTGAAAADKFATTYQTYATLCRLDTTVAPSVCSTTPSNEGSMIFTLVSRGSLTDESADAIVKQSMGTYRSIGRGPDAPLIAAASVGMGNAQIVPNPSAIAPLVAGGDSGDTPLSIWAKSDADVTSGASFATCNLGEWRENYGAQAPTAQEREDGVCPSCTCNGLCPGFGLLTGSAGGCTSGAGIARLENKDILDVDGNKSDADPQMLDSPYFPEDLFLYAFGVPSGSADRYLEDEAEVITDCGSLTPGSGGLYWYQGPGDCKLGSNVGSVESPVVLVSDAQVELVGKAQFFGIIFVRARAGTGDLLKATGGGQVYGSVLLEGDATMAGSPTLIYNKKVLDNILNSPNFLHLAPVPGSWSDDVQR